MRCWSIYTHKRSWAHDGRCIEFLQDYTFTLCHKARVENKAANALSRHIFVLTKMSALKSWGLNASRVPIFATTSPYWKMEWLEKWMDIPYKMVFVSRSKLCVPRTSLGKFLVWELHASSLTGHFGNEKTIEAVEYQFYWPSLKRDVVKHVRMCHTCQLVKKQKQISVCTLHCRYQIACRRTLA